MKMSQKHNMLRKVLSDSPGAVMRPLYNSIVAKVSIVKWSQNLIYVAGSPVLGLPKK